MLRGRPSTVNRGNYVTLFCLGFPMGGENLALIQLEQGRLTKAKDLHHFVKFLTCLRFLRDRCSPDDFLFDDLPLVISKVYHPHKQSDLLTPMAMDAHQVFALQP